ncbi:MAG: tryptophan synthase subunit alpha [Magnetococcales bacterium]|nr:tryptophan synthase subunit alpha [Magnetococcales bacterium]
MTDPSPLQSWLTARKRARDQGPGGPLLMSHLVLGHPSLEENDRVIDAMVAAGVDIMELQIPFSEPIADGPVIARANQSALDGGFRVASAFDMLARATRRHPIPFLIMTYYNILHAYGVDAFIRDAAEAGVRGFIVPDLPMEKAQEAMDLCEEQGLAWIQLFTPTTPEARLQKLGSRGRGLVYCVARKGVTGKDTQFEDQSLRDYLAQCRRSTDVPLAVGFGVSNREDVETLERLGADIAVVGTAAIRVHQEQGAEAVEGFFRGLKPE